MEDIQRHSMTVRSLNAKSLYLWLPLRGHHHITANYLFHSNSYPILQLILLTKGVPSFLQTLDTIRFFIPIRRRILG
jgi:hypothetical protein